MNLNNHLQNTSKKEENFLDKELKYLKVKQNIQHLI